MTKVAEKTPEVNCCDGGHDTIQEIRRYPLNSQENALLCRPCFNREKQGRGRPVKWESLTITSEAIHA